MRTVLATLTLLSLVGLAIVGLPIVGLPIVGLSLIAAARAQGPSCGELRFERNRLYKRAGYCFKTADMIRTFGNAGCLYDNEGEVPLSEEGRREVASIVRMEREMGCR